MFHYTADEMMPWPTFSASSFPVTRQKDMLTRMLAKHFHERQGDIVNQAGDGPELHSSKCVGGVL
jgi:hypothetical protein